MTKIRAVLFDMIGTTVLENDPTVISLCFGNAFRENSVEVHDDQIQNVRGMDKLEAIELILKNSQSQLKRKSASPESAEFYRAS
jgi:beta-phosphoglucomutase-like phosphatase (HAD superfamily)